MWAPEFAWINNTWHIVSTGRRTHDSPYSMFVLESTVPDDPLGPYKWKTFLGIDNGIDGSVFTWYGGNVLGRAANAARAPQQCPRLTWRRGALIRRCACSPPSLLRHTQARQELPPLVSVRESYGIKHPAAVCVDRPYPSRLCHRHRIRPSTTFLPRGENARADDGRGYTSRSPADHGERFLRP